MSQEKQTHVLMTGGGTLGPVTPLMAIVEEWRRKDHNVRLSWIGTPAGPERELIERTDIPFFPLWVPKLNRHQKWLWLFIPPFLFYSCMRSLIILNDLKPDIIFSAGGYVSVPVIWMAKIFKIPCWVHQLDVMPGFANKLMAPFAKRISVTWKESVKAFPEKKTSVVGGLAREEILSGNPERFKTKYGLQKNKPTVLILGGGTGAQSINHAVEVVARELLENINVVLLTGKGKLEPALKTIDHPGFVVKEFLNEEMADAMAAAQVVVARAGMGTIAELVSLKKPTILIPIRHSHQDKNAKALESRMAAHVIWSLNPQVLKQSIENIIRDDQKRNGLSQRIGNLFRIDADKVIVEEARRMI